MNGAEQTKAYARVAKGTRQRAVVAVAARDYRSFQRFCADEGLSKGVHADGYSRPELDVDYAWVQTVADLERCGARVLRVVDDTEMPARHVAQLVAAAGRLGVRVESLRLERRA